jgi:hypothetical protein
MDDRPIQQHSGQPWSGNNKIPNIKEFVSRLDRDKANRDKEIDTGRQPNQTEVTPHQNEKPKTQGKTVTDPVTGNQVVVADVGKEYMERADNPQVVQYTSKPKLQANHDASSLFPMPT